MKKNQKLAEIKEKYSKEPPRQATLLFLVNDNQILLAMKKRGLGVGKWNGVGGKSEVGETIEVAARRESFEEINVKPFFLKKVGIINFYHLGKLGYSQGIVFISKKWKGEPTETDEMAPKWFNINEIPYSEMWDDDILWLPKVLSGKIVEGNFLFDENQKMLEYEIIELA